jgi:selenophosphate synthase
MAPAALTQVLRPLAHLFSNHPDLLVGLGVADDAAVYQLNEQQAMISTVDFFTPVVDDRDPQTSGGLLLAVPVARWPAFEKACQEREQAAWIIGRVSDGYGIEVRS